MIPLKDGAFGVEVVIPETYPTTVTPFATEAEAEAWIARHKGQVESSHPANGVAPRVRTEANRHPYAPITSRRTGPKAGRETGPVSDVSSNPLNLNPQWMLLDLGHQQDIALLLFGDLKGIGTGDALALRMHGKGQGKSIFC